MSITGLNSEPSEKIYNKSFHRRNDSGELDVFEASRYFSGYNEPTTKTILTEKMMKEDRASWRSGGRISLDMPMRNILSHHHQQSHHQMVNEKKIKEKKYKQPNSPGGKLSSFLNSLFNQSSSKKKKSKSTQSMKDEDENPSGRRRRRSSISHFRSSSATNDSKSLHSSSISGFRTPPPYAQTPTKCYKEFKSYSDHKQVYPLSKYNGNNIIRSTASSQSDDQVFDGKREKDLSWLDEKFKYSNGFSEKYKNLGNKNNNSNNNTSFSEKEFTRFNEVDDGADSDSSSDLFELQNCDLGFYSNGLPVYETTNMDSIKIGAPISNAKLS